SSPLSCAMRSRQSCVSSTDESFLAASAAESSESVALSKLLDHLGDEVQAVLDRRRDRLINLRLAGLGHPVGTQPLPAGQVSLEGVRHRLDAAGIHGAHLSDQAKHPVEALERRNRVLALIDDMRAVDTSGIEPMAHPLEAHLPGGERLRPDQVVAPGQPQIYQAVAPAVEDGLYLVPKVVE